MNTKFDSHDFLNCHFFQIYPIVLLQSKRKKQNHGLFYFFHKQKHIIL